MFDHLADSLVDLVLPRRCLGCGDPGFGLCPDCRRPAPAQPVIAGVGPVFAATVYGGAVRRAILAYKEKGRRDVAADLALLLDEALRRCGPADAIVPIPSTRRARRRRGGDHVRRLVRSGSPAPVVDALRIVRPVADAAGLGRVERERNVAGAFRARPPFRPGQRAVLIDDVVTTGASLREGARALRAAGWVVVAAAVVAATPAPERGHGQDR